MHLLAVVAAVGGSLTTAPVHAQGWEESGEVHAAEPAPPPPELRVTPPGPFDQGRIRLGVGVGWASGAANDWLLLGLGGGYFVIDGLELGLDTGFWFVGDPFIATLSPEARYVFHMVPFVKPYVGTFYRHYFIADGREDSNSVGARGGVYFMIGSSSYLGVGVIYERFLDQNLYLDENQIYPEFSFALTF